MRAMSKDKISDLKQGVTFDMYRFFSRWDVILIVAFSIAFLIFAIAIIMNPQAV